MAVLKFTDLLLLFLMTGMTLSSNHHCIEGDLMNCTIASSNLRIRINKNHDHYRLSLCSNNTCTGNGNIIRCNQICQSCDNLLGSSCGKRDRDCENLVDRFLNNCGSVQLSTMLVAPSMTTQGMTVPVKITTTVLTSSMKRQSNSETVNNSPAVVVLGILFGVSLVVLAVVTTGWVCTCLIVKKREENKSSQHKLASTTDYEEKYLKNPTYGGIASIGGSTVGGTTVGGTTYETVNTSLSSQGNYDVLNRGQTIGQTTARDAQSTRAEGNYSQLGPHDHEHVNKE